VPSFEVRNRLRIAHEHTASSLHRAAAVHEEAASYWDAIHDPAAAEQHRQLARRCVEQAAEHEALAAEYQKPSRVQT
jgi:hypothetical protein